MQTRGRKEVRLEMLWRSHRSSEAGDDHLWGKKTAELHKVVWGEEKKRVLTQQQSLSYGPACEKRRTAA